MSKLEQISERISFVFQANELSIVIASAVNKSRAKMIAIIFCFWLIGGGIIGFNYFYLNDRSTKIFYLVWFAFWAYFSYVIIKSLLWHWSGVELIKIRNGKLIYKKDVGGRGWVFDYRLETISNLRCADEKTPNWIKKIGGDFWGVDCDSISFDYEAKEIRFGYNLTDSESNRILDIMNPYISIHTK